jgi:hypothetical protein
MTTPILELPASSMEERLQKLMDLSADLESSLSLVADTVRGHVTGDGDTNAIKVLLATLPKAGSE